jgi:hypothetical protein
VPASPGRQRPHQRRAVLLGRHAADQSYSSGISRNSLAISPMVMSPGCMASVGTAVGLILIKGGSSGSVQITCRLLPTHRLILSMQPRLPRLSCLHLYLVIIGGKAKQLLRSLQSKSLADAVVDVGGERYLLAELRVGLRLAEGDGDREHAGPDVQVEVLGRV